MTKPMSKPLLPVYDKLMIYYPLAILMQAGISDVMVIVPPNETDTFRALLGNGSQCGIHICYAEQPVARGIADALLIGCEFVGNDSVCLVLGDNIFHSDTLREVLCKGAQQQNGATVFGYWVENPRPFGVVEFDEDGRAISIEEKPRYPKSNYIIPGIYFFENATGVAIKHEFGARRAGDLPEFWANADKAAKVLGWKAERDLTATCRDTWRWQSGNREGYRKIGE